MVNSAQSATIVQLEAVYLVYQGQPDAEGEGLSCAVLASPCGDVNDFVLSQLPEFGTMGSKRGSWGDPLLYQLKQKNIMWRNKKEALNNSRLLISLN